MTDADPFADITAHDSPMTFAEVFADLDFAKLTVPSVVQGEQCSDFTLDLYDFSTGHGVKTGEQFCLSHVSANQPVALIFGSYT